MRKNLVAKNFSRFNLVTLVAVAALVVFTGTNALAAVSSVSGVTGVAGDCAIIYAGQNIIAGDVCFDVIGENLEVTYTTTGGWELVEAHMWIGGNLADMPQNRKGNPKIGNFPHNSGDITGAFSHTFIVPLSELGGEIAIYDDLNFDVAAHAAVQMPDGNGGYQNETGWSDGSDIIEKGSRATFTTITFYCDNGEEPPAEVQCETAFAFGSTELDDIPDLTVEGETITDRWGWQIGPVNQGGSGSQIIWAGAGQNDTTKGMKVGTLSYSYVGETVTVTFDMGIGFYMEETHLYVGYSDIQTAAPGQFGNLHEDLGEAGSDSYELGVDGSSVYIVAHAVVCGGSSSFNND